MTFDDVKDAAYGAVEQMEEALRYANKDEFRENKEIVSLGANDVAYLLDYIRILEKKG